MDNATFFLNPVNSIQLLSVFDHINTLSDFLYIHNFLAKNNQFQPIPVVNSLFDYFEKNNNDPEVKSNLVHKLLKDSDLYGAKRNESIDSIYIDIMFDYIISDVVFKKFGNIYGFLIDTLISTDNLTLSNFLNGLYSNLRSSSYSNEDGSTSRLSDLATRKIYEKLLAPLFPQLERNISVLSPDYLYALAGLSFAHAVNLDLQNVTFDELIEISQTIELSVHEGQISSSALNIFSLPAILHFAKTKKHFKREKILHTVTNPHSWIGAYTSLFTYLDSTLKKLRQTLEEDEKGNYVYQFKLSMSRYKTRTQLAEENIRVHCPLEKEGDYEKEISNYKFSPKAYYCERNDVFLPNINDIFIEQNEEIVQRYFLMELKLIEEAFGRLAINMTNAMDMIIFENQAKYSAIAFNGLGPIPIYAEHVLENADLLEVYVPSNQIRFYIALIRENDKIALITEQNRDFFRKKLGLSPQSEFERSGRVLKPSSGTFQTFAERVARKRAEVLSRILNEKGYDETGWEKAVRIILSLIPFYNCIDSVAKGKSAEATVECTLDVVSLIPVYGKVAAMGAKVATKVLLSTFDTSIRTLLFRESLYLALRTMGKAALGEAATQFTHLFTMETFRSISKSLLRSLDPGFEFLGRLTPYGIKTVSRLFSLIGKRLSASFSTRLAVSLSKLKSVMSRIKIGKFGPFDVHVNSLSGKGGFGQRYVSTPFGNFELRKEIGFVKNIPVKKVNPRENLYRKVNLRSGKTYGTKLQLKTNILQPLNPKVLEKVKHVSLVRGNDAVALAGENLGKVAKERREQEAIDVLKEGTIDEDQVRKTLREYILEEEGKREIDVALYWKQHSKLPPWISHLKVDEPEVFWKLRYEEKLAVEEISLHDARVKVQKLYGRRRMEELEIDVVDIVKSYNKYHSHVYTTFEDLYAIVNYIEDGYQRIRYGTEEARRMQNAFYRLAVRQIDTFEGFPKLLYRGEERSLAVANSFTEGSIINVNQFFSVTMKQSVAHYFLGLRGRKGKASILYEIEIDSPFLAANIYKIYPTEEAELVILPGVRLVVDGVENVVIDKRIVKKIRVKNLPVNKSKWIVMLMRKIKRLKESGTEFYYDISADVL